MTGTLLNMLTVFIGGSLGLLVGNRLSARYQESVVTGLGLVTLFVGISNANATGNVVIPLLALVIGALLGEWLRLDVALERLASWLQVRSQGARMRSQGAQVQSQGAQAQSQGASRAFSHAGEEGASAQPPSRVFSQDAEEGIRDRRERFITGFVTASLVFCVGPLTFVGSLQDGMGLAVGLQALTIKSVLDGFAALAFAASFGVGVLFTVVTVLVVQGGLALVGMLLVGALGDPAATGTLATHPLIREMTAVGGFILLGLALVLLDIKKPRIANFLPALLVAPTLVLLAQALGVDIYPF